MWESYLSYAIKREFKSNTYILRPGDKVTHLCYVQKGEVLVTRYFNNATKQVFVARDGAMTGFLGLFMRSLPQASWRTLQPCTCWLFPKACVVNGLPQELLLNLLEQQTALGCTMIRRCPPKASRGQESRTAQMLLHIMDICGPGRPRNGGRVNVVPNISQEMVSGLLDMHPVTLNRILATFRTQGIIGKFTKTSLEILDVDELIQRATSPSQDTCDD
ncbi:MAG: Crp/Fnr family transcriptional regulator [Desulfovibrio sp.]|jgi:CRP-like cAMP-binding protein|nr:Crp/Fnr family transcriptional regulator [Desulfovibrio sp.]